MSEPRPPDRGAVSAAEVEAQVRRYLMKLARRWAPGLAAALAVGLVVAFVSPVGGGRGNQQSLSSGTGQGHGTGEAGAAASGPVPAGQAPGAAGGSLTSAGGVSSPGAQPSVSGAPDVGGPGRTVSGVACGPGVSQVQWSHYAGPCVPAYHGPNGGATAYGVTGTTVTVTARISNSGESAAVEASAQGAFPTQQQYLHDLQAYVNYFNTQFELYGRHVVFKVFQGQGDWLQEYQGQDLAGAQADAVTAHDLGGFADATTGIDATTPAYAADLAEEHVISIGGVVASQSFLQQYAPYIWTALGTVTDVANFDGGMICERMAGLPAAFAGDAATRLQHRVFGIINPENPDYSQAGDMIQNDIRGCGATVGKRVNYALDISTLETQDTTAIASMKAAGVTTIVCLCDNVSPIFLTQAADQQQYHPEWISLNAGDEYEQLRAQDQWAHALSPGGRTLDPKTIEAYHVYKLADPSGEPAELTRLSLAYGVAMQLFNGLQAAGPNLTAAGFERAQFSLPASQPGGDLGPWTYGQNAFSPLAATRIGWYDPNAPSPIDNKAGSWQSCAAADGDFHPIRSYQPGAYGADHTQLHCFGQ